MGIVNLIAEEDKGGKWLFLIPIFGVELDSSINNELKLNKITLISKNKLLRVRKRIGLVQRLSHYEKSNPMYEKTKTFAFAYFSNNNPDELLEKFEAILKDELAYLSASQIITNKRSNNAYITMANREVDYSQDVIITNTTKLKSFRSSILKGRHNKLYINKQYIENQKSRGFLLPFLKIVRGNTSMDNSMITSIKNAVVFYGKSHDSTELHLSFLYNMIAIDSLLSSRNDKHKDSALKAVECFIGWSKLWDEPWKESVSKIYELRASLVHDGNHSEIKVENLLFTDQLLRNILFNICNHPKLFKNKEELKNFFKKLDAEKTLKVSTKILPKTFRTFKVSYSNIDLENH